MFDNVRGFFSLPKLASVGCFFATCCGICLFQRCCLWPAVPYLYQNYLFLITLQEEIDTVKVEGVENVGEEDGIKIKTEEDYIQLVRTVKTEQEVSVLCWCVCVYACVLYCTHCIQVRPRFIRAYQNLLFSACQSAVCTCVICCVWLLCVQIIISFSTPLTTGCLHAWGNQY